MVPSSFETHRLTARRPTVDDIDFLRLMHTDAGTMKTLSEDGSILGEKKSQQILGGHLRHWDRHYFGIWLFEQSSDRKAVGYCGLRECRLLHNQETELFFGIRSRYFRNGFGTEMARSVLSVGFEELNLTSIVGFTLEDNVASRALMTRIGMVYVDIVQHAGLPHLLYRLSQSAD